MRLTPLLAVPVCALVLSACGSSGSSSSSTPAPAPAPSTTSTSSAAGGGSSSLSLAAQDSGGLSFSKKSLTAKAGKVTLTMANPSGNSQMHGIAISGGGVNQSGSVVQPGGSSTVTVTLKPGKYTFFCPVPGHRQAGMVGTLTVQ